MAEESADELAGGKRHGPVTAWAFDAVILVAERDADLVGGDQPTVGNGDTMGIARQIGQYRLRATKRGLCVDIPLDLVQRRQVGGERFILGKRRLRAEELN